VHTTVDIVSVRYLKKKNTQRLKLKSYRAYRVDVKLYKVPQIIDSFQVKSTDGQLVNRVTTTKQKL